MIDHENDNSIKYCGYCDDKACRCESEDLQTITIISADHKLPFELLQTMKTYIASGDGYDEDLDGLVGFTANTNILVPSFLKILVTEAPEHNYMVLNECESWGFILEVSR